MSCSSLQFPHQCSEAGGVRECFFQFKHCGIPSMSCMGCEVQVEGKNVLTSQSSLKSLEGKSDLGQIVKGSREKRKKSHMCCGVHG